MTKWNSTNPEGHNGNSTKGLIKFHRRNGAKKKSAETSGPEARTANWRSPNRWRSRDSYQITGPQIIRCLQTARRPAHGASPPRQLSSAPRISEARRRRSATWRPRCPAVLRSPRRAASRIATPWQVLRLSRSRFWLPFVSLLEFGCDFGSK